MKLSKKVKDLLEAKPALRDSDKKLILAVWMTEGLKLEPDQIETILDKCSVPESITRARRDIQSEYPELQASDNIQQERKIKEQRYRSGNIDEVSHSGYQIDYQNGVVYRV